MLEWIQHTMQALGYPGIAFLMFLENVFPPIPSEVIMPLAGFVSSQGALHFIGVVIAGTIGSVAGALPLYYIGRVLHEDRLVEWADRYGKWLSLSGKDIRRADDWFDKHGTKAVFFGRLVPGLRSLISIPAGMSEMNIWQFLIYTTLGASIWTALLAALGLWLGERYELVEQYIGPISYIVLGTLVVAAAVWLWRRRRQRAQTA